MLILYLVTVTSVLVTFATCVGVTSAFNQEGMRAACKGRPHSVLSDK